MNLDLAAMYGTLSSEDREKLAEAELFSKLAADNGIDISKLDNDQLQYLWNETMGEKTAEDESKETKEHEESETPQEEKEEEKKEAAAREHAVKLAHAEEEQRAHHLGQVMAHSYVAELQKIAAAREALEGGEEKDASAMGKLMAARDAVKGGAGKAMSKAKELGGKAMKSHAVGAAALGTTAAGAGYGAGRLHEFAKGKKKEGSSTIDELALEHAVKLAHEANLDVEKIAQRLDAVAVLGLAESDKLASTLDDQVHIRALEYLEAAGVPVTWDKGQQA